MNISPQDTVLVIDGIEHDVQSENQDEELLFQSDNWPAHFGRFGLFIGQEGSFETDEKIKVYFTVKNIEHM